MKINHPISKTELPTITLKGRQFPRSQNLRHAEAIHEKVHSNALKHGELQAPLLIELTRSQPKRSQHSVFSLLIISLLFAWALWFFASHESPLAGIPFILALSMITLKLATLRKPKRIAGQ